MEQYTFKLRLKKNFNRIKSKVKSNSGEAGFKSVFILFIGMIVIAMLFKIFMVIAISFSARDTLDRAVLNSASASMENSEVYVYLRNGGNGVAPTSTIEHIFADNLHDTLTNDLGLSGSNAKGTYSHGDYYTINIKSYDFGDSSKNTFTVNATLSIPINFFNVNNFDINITSQAKYESISATT